MNSAHASYRRRPRVVIIDHSPVVRDGLPFLIHGVSFVGSYASWKPLMRDHPTADVALVDFEFDQQGPIAVHAALDALERCRYAGYRICVYSNERREHVLLRCLRAGANGIIAKSESTEILARAIDDVASGRFAVSRAYTHLAELAERFTEFPALTERQRQVLAGRARGEPFRRIARTLSISEKTAQEHWSIVHAKFARYLRTHSAADLERMLGLDDADAFSHIVELAS